MWLRRLLDPIKRVWKFRNRVIAMADDKLVAVTKIERQFDFKKFARRRILLMISYLGWDYHGLMRQPDVEKTIEGVLLQALLKTRLIESIETANTSRCGRTDKGVSAFRQVVSVDVRSLMSEGEGVFVPEGYTPCIDRSTGKGPEKEMNYIATLNRSLPDDVRVLAWASAPEIFSARHDCRQRTYKYFFPRGHLDIQAMREAGQLLLGTHDFRNFCKLDLSRNCVKETIRRIDSVDIEQADMDKASTDPYTMYVLTIRASSYLWQQIRNIVTLLVLVGRGNEEPGIITTLLDVETCPKKPQYMPALDCPLVLYDCVYENVKWQWDIEARKCTISELQRHWVQLAAKAQMVKSMCDDLTSEAAKLDPSLVGMFDISALTPGDRRKKYMPLMKRATGLSLEEHRERCEVKKARKEREQSQSPPAALASDASV